MKRLFKQKEAKESEPLGQREHQMSLPTLFGTTSLLILDAAQREDTLSSIVPRVEDIKKAISLGDRFLFQRELFAGNGEQMNKTIEYLNGLSSLEEALKYIEKFGWNKDSNAYELFTNIL